MRKLPALFSLLLFFACGKKNDPSPVVVQPASPSITSVMPDSSAVGYEVTITGANFSTVSDKDIVQFNGIAATVTQASATQLKVTVPTGASNGKITVSIGGQMATSAGNFFVLTGSWIQKADFAGGGRTRASGFSIGNNGYVIGGHSGITNADATDFWQYNSATDTWTKKADFPGGAREYAVAFSIGNKGYVGLGFGSAAPANFEYNDFWEYDPDTDKWIQKNNVPFIGRETAISFVTGNYGYVGCGTNFTYVDNLKDFWQYDPTTDTWLQKADYPGSGPIMASAFSLNGKGFAGLGANATQGGTNQFWQYDPTTNAWTSRADFPGTARDAATAFAIGSKGYMGFGTTSVSLGDLWEYDPLNNTWTRKADFTGTPRYDLVGFSIGDKAYIGTGNNGNLKDFWQFNP